MPPAASRCAEFALRVQEAYGNDASDTARADAFINYTYQAALQREPDSTELPQIYEKKTPSLLMASFYLYKNEQVKRHGGGHWPFPQRHGAR